MRLNSLCSFLESLYVELEPGMGCLKESPRIESGVCYTNTNYLALHALHVCGSRLTGPLTRFIERFDIERNGRFEALWLEPIPYPPRAVKTILLERVEAAREAIEIRADAPSGVPLPDWYEYADLLVLAILEGLRRGSGAVHGCVDRVVSLWDGRGFADKAYRETGLYETYKLSLYYFLARVLQVEDTITRKVQVLIRRLLSGEGGIVTHYDADVRRHGDPNVETTSITILAFYNSYPEAFPRV